jgi:hypothetical protein
MPCDPDGFPVEGWERYIVHDHVGEAADGEGWLCVGCLEARLGCRLTRDDFPAHLPINNGPCGLRSERLRGRLGAWEAVASWGAAHPGGHPLARAVSPTRTRRPIAARKSSTSARRAARRPGQHGLVLL